MLLLLADLGMFLPKKNPGLRLYVMETSSPSTISPLLSLPPNFIIYLVHVSAISCHTAIPTS